MKTFYRLLAMLLACTLLLGLGMTAACADTCYEMIKFTFSVEDNGDFAWLGQGTLMPGDEPKDPANNPVFFVIAFDSGYASVIGLNASGEPENCLWLEPDPAELLLASVQVAASYEELSGSLDQCTQLVIILDAGEDAEPLYIASAEDAQAYLTMMQDALGNSEAEAVAE